MSMSKIELLQNELFSMKRQLDEQEALRTRKANGENIEAPKTEDIESLRKRIKVQTLEIYQHIYNLHAMYTALKGEYELNALLSQPQPNSALKLKILSGVLIALGALVIALTFKLLAGPVALFAGALLLGNGLGLFDDARKKSQQHRGPSSDLSTMTAVI